MYEFGALNWGVLAVYLIANIGLGVFLSTKVQSANDFFLGDKSIPWWAIGISVVATYVSALSFLGGPAWSYSEGMAVIAIHLNYPLVIVFVITFLLPFFYNSGVASIHDYLEKRFGLKARTVMSAIFLTSQGLTTAAAVYATALVINFITGFGVTEAIIIVTVIALLYTMMGGIAAVIWTDVVQAGILLVGALIIFAALLDALPDGLMTTLESLKDKGMTDALVTKFSLAEVSTVWSGVIAMTLFHITVYGANQMMVQRTLTSKNIGDAKKSYMMMGYGAIFIYFLFLLLGVLFHNYYDGKTFENGNTIILDFASTLAIPGLMGLIAAAVVAASMSSLDSALNSMSTVTTIDIYQKFFKPEASDEHYLKASRWFTVFWAAMIIGPAILYASSEGSILETLSKVGSFFVGAKLSLFGLGIFSKHTTERGVLIGVLFGFASVWYVASYTDIAWPWFCAIGAITNTVVALAASLILDGKAKEHSQYTIVGQRKWFAETGTPTTENGWSLLPGKLDRASLYLLGFFVVSIVALWAFNTLI